MPDIDNPKSHAAASQQGVTRSPSEVLPPLGSSIVNEASWAVLDALAEHGPIPANVFNWIKPAFYAGLTVVLAATVDQAEPIGVEGVADQAAWEAWPSSHDYPERDAYRQGFAAALAATRTPDPKAASITMKEAGALVDVIDAIRPLMRHENSCGRGCTCEYEPAQELARSTLELRDRIARALRGQVASEPNDPKAVSGNGDAAVEDEDDPCPNGTHCCCCGPGEPCCDCGKIIAEPAPSADAGLVPPADAFEMGYVFAMSLRGQNLEDSRAVGRNLYADNFAPIAGPIAIEVERQGFNSFTDADAGIVQCKNIIRAALSHAKARA